MNRKSFARGLAGRALLLMALLVSASSAPAATVDLWTRQFAKTMPDGTVVNMWGFADSAAGTPSSPGPVVTVPVGDTSLEIVLHNELPEATSVVIPGLPGALSPSFAAGRVTSFTTETAAGTTSALGTYRWTNIKPGTYLYQSGTHPAVQVQMGLYGAVVQDAAAGQAYGPSSTYTTPQVLVYSEVDPALHGAVAPVAGVPTYGTPGGPSSTLNYKPVYFLVNGEAYTSAQPALTAAGAGQTTLLRLLNAGLKTHVPTLQATPLAAPTGGTSGYLKVIAEDANPYPYARDQYSAMLAAGKTSDALWTPTAVGTYALYDRALHLATGKSQGGMLVKLQVGAGGPAAPVAVADAHALLEDGGLFSVPAPGVLGNDSGSNLVASLVSGVNPANGALVLNSNGSFDFTPAANFFGAESFTYTATDTVSTLVSNVATVTLTVSGVNDAPTFIAGASQAVNAGSGAQTVVGWATSISKGPANESAQSMLPFVVNVTSNSGIFSTLPAVAANGTLTYTPVASIGATTVANVNVQAKDDGGTVNGGVDTSPVQSFSITVNPAPPAATKHVGDLDRSTSASPTGPQWTGTVTIGVHTGTHANLAGAIVTGTWNQGSTTPVSCTTGGTGRCSISRTFGSIVSSPASATFTVTGVTGTGGAYVPADNHDPDLGGQASNGTSITVPRPASNP